MSSLDSNVVIDLLERYLQAPDKEAFFATLVKGSSSHERLRLIDHLNRYGLKVPTETRAALEELMKSPSERKETLASFKTQLLQIAADNDEKKRKKRMKDFNDDFLHCRFNHQRPANVEQGGRLAAATVESGLPNTCDCAERLSLENVVQRVLHKAAAEDRVSPVSALRQAYYHHYELDALLAARGPDDFSSVLRALPSYTHVTDLADVLVKYASAWRKKHDVDRSAVSLVDEDTFRKMTVAQIEAFERGEQSATGHPSVVAAKFLKEFEADLDTTAQADADAATRRATLERMLAWADAQATNQRTLGLRAQVLREVLETDLEANRVEESIFLRYVANPVAYERGVFPAPPQGVTPVSADQQWFGVHRFPRSRWHGSERELVSACLQHLLADAATASTRVRSYEGVLLTPFLQQEYCRARLLSGADASDASSVFSESELTALREERRLRFVPWNKKSFAPGERVDLLLEVKNVDRVTVSVFEMDTEGYYRDHQGPLDGRVNLTGLIPSKRVEQVLEAAPIVSRVMEFKDLFDAQRGVYIVEFVGGGLSSRAVVRVGGLAVVRQVVSKGLLLHIVDESRSICTGPTTGLLVDGRVMRPQESLGGGILVPYGDTAREESGVLLHEGYAEPYWLSVPAEDVAFSFGLLVNEESVAIGGAVRLVLAPRLAVNGRRVGLASLRKVCVHVTSVNDAQVSNATTFDDVKLDKQGRSVALDYLVPPRTQRVEVRVTAEFYSSARETSVDLSCVRTIGVDGRRGEQVFYDYYLTPDAASAGCDYVLELLGKNGEPYAKQRLDVELVPVYAGANETVRCETDAEGRVRLVGAGSCVSAVRVRSVDAPSSVSIAKEYILASDDELACVPPVYDVVEGEEVSLPLCQRDGSFDVRRYELVRVTRSGAQSVVADLAAHLNDGDGAVVVRGLSEGRFRFRYRDAGGGKTVYINVVRGQRWEAAPSGYIVTSRGIRRVVRPGLGLSLRGFHLDASSGAVEVRLSSQNAGSAELHAFAFSYYPRSLPELRRQLAGMGNVEQGEEFPFRTTKSAYLSGKRLSDEVKYVLDRQHKKPYMGSTLEKPPGLLQRHFMRETTEDEEVLEDEQDYTHEALAMEDNAALLCEMPAPAAPMAPQAMYAAAPAAMPRGGARRMKLAQQQQIHGDYTITRLNTFLASAGWSAVCCAPEDGVVRLQVPMDAGYSTLVLVARDSSGAVVETHALPVGTRPRVDARLAESKSANLVYVSERAAHGLRSGEEYTAADASSTDMRLVDDVATVLRVQRVLSSNTELDEWSFLGEWESLSPRERLRKYDKYMCHEFNVFAYFKDREFFDAVVRPHVACKTRRSVVDDFLLGDIAALEKCLADPTRVAALDVLELALLVAALSKAHPTECVAIAKGVRERVGLVKDRNQREYERLFDSVLSSKTPEEDVAGTQVNVASMATANSAMRMRGGPHLMMARAAPMAAGGFAMDAANNMDFAGKKCKERSAPLMEADECEENLAYDDADGLGGANAEEDFMAPRMEIRKYRVVGTTNEYVERQYYAGATLRAPLNYFWADVVEHFATNGAAGAPLISSNFIYATSSTAEMLVAAAVLGVGTAKATHGSERVGQSLRVRAGGDCMVFSREIRAKGEEKVDLDVLATQRMVDPYDLYTTVAGTRALKPVTEFLVGKLYASRVVVTNATESELKLSLVTEVPQGAVPVVELEYAETEQLVMAPLSTETHEFHFYFPSPGEFSCFPASVNKDGQLVVSAKQAASSLRVVRARTVVQMETISDILNQGTTEDILAFMERENLHDRNVFTFDAIYWLLSDASFYVPVLALLRRKRHFDATVWSYSVVHADRDTFGEYLGWRYRQSPLRLRVVDGRAVERVQYVQVPLLQLDDFEYREYNPLVNARAHDVGRNKHNIRNRQFRETYDSFLRYLFQKSPALTRRDYVYWCTYLLLQDRVEEAQKMHAQHIVGDHSASEDDGELQLQRDYLTAYLSLYTDAPTFAAAREVATRYLTYPVFTWRNRFIEVLNQVAEAGAPVVRKAGGEDAVTETDRNAAQAESEPYLSCELDGRTVRLTVSNLSNVSLRFYRVDLEVLYSQNPFLDAEVMDYSYVAANYTVNVPVEGNAPQLTAKTVDIPEELSGCNLIVQAVNGALVSSATYFPNKMDVFVNRNFGQVRVVDKATGAPLPLVYVKAFAQRHSGEVGFFKDGYTDLRGTFEYASVHGGSGKLDEVGEFSLLVLSETAGAVLKRAKPPSRTAEVTVGGAAVRSAALQQTVDRMVSESTSKYCV